MNVEQLAADSLGIADVIVLLGDQLARAIAEEQRSIRRLKDLQKSMEAEEAEVIMEASIEALSKTGPLAGIAKTSKEYEYAIKALLKKARGENGPLNNVYVLWRDLESEAIEATIQREQLSTKFSAAKAAGNIRAEILKALS